MEAALSILATEWLHLHPCSRPSTSKRQGELQGRDGPEGDETAQYQATRCTLEESHDLDLVPTRSAAALSIDGVAQAVCRCTAELLNVGGVA